MNNKYDDLLKNSNNMEIKQILKKIAENKDVEAIPTLLNLLIQTEDNGIRNEVALTLSDLKTQEAVNPIIEMIKDSKTDGNRGTLIYALEELDYSEHLSFIFSLLLKGNFEVSRTAYFLIEKSLEKRNEDTNLVKKQIPLLVDKIRQLQDEIEFYLAALELLSK